MRGVSSLSGPSVFVTFVPAERQAAPRTSWPELLLAYLDTEHPELFVRHAGQALGRRQATPRQLQHGLADVEEDDGVQTVEPDQPDQVLNVVLPAEWSGETEPLRETGRASP